jgi:CheY-like chemotaxis protein
MSRAQGARIVDTSSILIVDDNPQNLKLARVLFTSHGYHVLTAADAEQAISVVAQTPPKLILMDLQLPGMDGLELTRRLKADPLHRQTIIVAVTASAMKGDEEKAARAGCDGYVTKPIDTRGLPALIRSYLSRGD